MPDLPEIRTVDYGLIAAVLAKFGLDYWSGKSAKVDTDAIKADTERLRENVHLLRTDVNRDVGQVSLRVTRLEQSEQDVARRLGSIEEKIDRGQEARVRMEDKLDRLLDRGRDRA